MSDQIKSNPYVYPYIPFKDLSQKDLSGNITDHQTISWDDLKVLIQAIDNPEPTIEGNTTVDKILSIFLDENYRFGPRKHIDDNKQKWAAKVQYFIDRDEPIQFTILGFPFKIPVALKTNRELPDLGEILALQRLQVIMEHVAAVYEPGAQVTLFTEGAFGKFVGVGDAVWIAYRKFLEEALEKLSFDKVVISDLVKMEASVANFDELHSKKVIALKRLYEERDEAFLKKYDGTFTSVYRIVNPGTNNLNLLMDVYNEDLSNDDVSEQVREIRKTIEQETHDAVFTYHAYLMVRDDIDYLQQVVPQSLTLSVSPKPTRLGVIPIHKNIDKLPYHSVPIYDSSSRKSSQEYLIDLLRDSSTYTAIHLDRDVDPNPFYYSLNHV